MRPGEERELARAEFQAKLPSSYGHRRTPRVRLRKGNGALFIILGTRRTKRAAFRAARELRDAHGERRPQVVWQSGPHTWHHGTRIKPEQPPSGQGGDCPG